MVNSQGRETVPYSRPYLATLIHLTSIHEVDGMTCVSKGCRNRSSSASSDFWNLQVVMDTTDTAIKYVLLQMNMKGKKRMETARDLK